MPDDTQELLEKARERLDDEDYSGAMEFLKRIREVDARTVEVLHEKAFCHLGLGEPKKTLECYDAAVELGNVDADLWNDRAYVLLELGRHREAVVSAKKALDLDAEHYAAHCNAARAFLELNDGESAFELATRAVEFNPLEEEGIFLKAEAARKLARRDEAIAAYGKVLMINPHNTQARYRLDQMEQYRKMDKVRKWDSIWERWSGLERLPFVIGFLLPGILLVALGALVPTIKGGNVLLFRAISISVGIILILISAAVMLSGRKSKKEPGR